ncbi:AAA family ATPase [Streptomyces sp. IBSNAI002]|uniref:AAA family ATPase n=1 Tax=Streptomyces sp. IBSNAI002 TaxID=3457500 RepID=UPI003FD4A7CE
MSAEELDGIVRRRLVVVAVDGYKDSPPGFDEAIARQVERITGWLADPALDDARRFEVHQAPPVRTVQELREFLCKENLAAAEYQEAVVVYITGHGLRRVAPRHFLTLPETNEERPFATAFPTSELITAVLDSESEHVLVLVDSCFSGTLDTELTSLLEALGKDRRGHGGAAVVTAGDHDVQPLVGSFTERVARAWERMRDEAAGFTAPYLSFREWEQLLYEVGRDEHGAEKDLVEARWIVPRSSPRGLSACLPNPRYQPPVSTTGPALRQLAVTPPTDADEDAEAAEEEEADALDEFWPERASGRAAADDAGWYFSGRAEQMGRLTGFLRDGDGVLVVTGAAGSGKSALLARLVTLSDRAFAADPRYAAMVEVIPEALRPVPGSVDVAVLARNKPAGVVVQDLVTGFGAEHVEASSRPAVEVPVQALLRLVLERTEGGGGPVTVVIDALDEADDPLAVFNDVVLPLARLRKPGGTRRVRLLLGIRSSPDLAYRAGDDLVDERADQLLLRLTQALEDEGLVPGMLRSDGPDCAGDIAAYAATLLLAPADGPYHGAPDAAAEAAAVIAEAVAPSFLDARIAADQLRRAQTRQDLTEYGWQERLADGTSGLLREDVQAVSRSSGVPAALLVAALRATAFAPGAGLPWAEVWPAVTAALAGSDHGSRNRVDAADRAIRALRTSRLTGYLATAEEDARTVYRPVHQRLSDLLLANPEWLLVRSSVQASHWWRPPTAAQALAAAHASITGALAGLVEQSRPHLAHPYVRRHFLHHAAAGEVLDDQSVPLELLAQETSGTLRARLGLPLPTADPRRRLLTAAALIEPYLDDTVDEASRTGSITFQRDVRDEPWEAPDDLPATLAWGQWAARANVLAPARGETRALCVLPTLDGRALIAVLSETGSVRIWNASTGRLTAELGRRHGRVRGLRPIRATGGRTFLVTWGMRGVTIHDPSSGQPLSALSLPRVVDVHVLEDGPARWKLFIITADGTFVWRPSTRGASTGKVITLKGFPEAVRPLRSGTTVVRRASGHALVAFPSPEGIRLWDPFSGLTGHPPFGGAGARVLKTVSRPERDDLLVVSAGPEAISLTRLWDPFLGEPVRHSPLRGRAQAVLPDGEALVYSRGSRVVVQDINGRWEESFEADHPRIDALAVLDEPAGPRLVSAGPEGIRLWDIGRETAVHEDEPAQTRYAAPRGLAGLRPRMWPLCRTDYPGVDSAGDVVVVGTHFGLDVHDAVTGRLVKQLETGPVLMVEPIPSPPGSACVVVEGRSSWSVWDLVSGEAHAVRGDRPPNSRLYVTTTAAGLPMVVSMARGREIRCTVWDPAAGAGATATQLPRPPIELARFLVPLPARPGAAQVVAAVGARGIELVDLDSGRVVAGLRRPDGAGSFLRRACVLPFRGRVLLAAASSTGIQVWDTADGRPLARWDTSATLALADVPLPDGRTLLAAGDAGAVRLWDPLTGELRHTLLTGAPVHALTAGTGPAGTALHVLGPAGLATLTLDESSL